MTKFITRAAIVGAIFPTVLAVFGSAAFAAAAKPADTCKNPLLPYRQQYLCQEELDVARTKPEQKKIQRKFTDMIREAEKAQKEK